MNEHKNEKPGMNKEWHLLIDILYQKAEQQERTQIDQIIKTVRTLNEADKVLDMLALMIKSVVERLEEEKGEGNFQLKEIKLWVLSGENRTINIIDPIPHSWGYFSVVKSLHEENRSFEPPNYELEIYIYFE